MEDAATIEKTAVASAKADDIVVVFEFGQTHELADDRLSDEGEFAAPRSTYGRIDAVRSCLSSVRPELRAIGRERGSNEHEDG